jgi:hypothetical protein
MLFAEPLFNIKNLSIATYIRKKILKKLSKPTKAKKQCWELPLNKGRIEYTK